MTRILYGLCGVGIGHAIRGRVIIEELIKEKPERMLYLSVKRMLPKNKMSSRQILRLKMYKGSTHPHAVQNPVKLEVIS